MFLDTTQVVIFFMACAVQFQWFGVSGYGWVVVPLVIFNLVISWFVVAMNDFRSDAGAAILAILEALAYLGLIFLHSLLLESPIVLPVKVVEACTWVLPTVVIMANFGQRLFAFMANKFPRKFNNGLRRVSG
jgi:hypothetical protein